MILTRHRCCEISRVNAIAFGQVGIAAAGVVEIEGFTATVGQLHRDFYEGVLNREISLRHLREDHQRSAVLRSSDPGLGANKVLVVGDGRRHDLHVVRLRIPKEPFQIVAPRTATRQVSNNGQLMIFRSELARRRELLMSRRRQSHALLDVPLAAIVDVNVKVDALRGVVNVEAVVSRTVVVARSAVDQLLPVDLDRHLVWV